MKKSSFHSLLARMRADIRLAIVTLYCISALALITPFAIYRLYIGDFVTGVSELVILATFVGLMTLAWRPGKSQLAADLTACSATLGIIAVALALDISYLWTFSTLVGNFLMARLKVAVILSTILIASLGSQTAEFESVNEQMSYLAVATLVSLFSMIFATRVNTQRNELNHIAARDGLTGAFNRRTMDHDLSELNKLNAESGETHCLAILDLDNFKALNDSFGHEAGDEILIRLTEIVGTSTREKDRFYRYGGEEFVLLLPRTSIAGAQVALNNLRQALAAQLSGPGGLVTASFGLAEYRSPESVAEWLKRADLALFEAKQTGKNRVVTAS